MGRLGNSNVKKAAFEPNYAVQCSGSDHLLRNCLQHRARAVIAVEFSHDFRNVIFNRALG